MPIYLPSKRIYSLKPLLSFLSCFLFLTLGTQHITAQTVYVNISVSGGTQDGTSWQNAYSDLSSALANVESGDDLWLATGTYFPGGTMPDSNSRFTIAVPVNLYGGFIGSETNLEERDVAANPTILSGDIAENDIEDDFVTNKIDNTLHVVYVDSLLNAPVTLDGLTVTSGHNNDFLDGVPNYFWSGAGIYAYSPLTIRNCTFTQNLAGSGAAVYFNGTGASGSNMENCLVTQNFGINQAAVYAFAVEDLQIDDCNFVANRCNRGAFYPSNCTNVTVTNCSFENNVNQNGFGGGAFSWQNYGVLFQGCVFSGNRAQNAGAMYVDGSNDIDNDINRFRMIDCLFENNIITDFGAGALSFWRASYTLEDCNFSDNQAAGTAGGLGNFGGEKTFRVTNTTFTRNSADFGGGAVSYGVRTQGYYGNCTFENNQAFTSGGGATNGFMADVSYEDCDFTGNSASFGGAIYVQNDTTTISVLNSRFSENSAENNGGGVNVAGGIVSVFDDCVFELNEGAVGGGLFLADGENDLASSTITNSRFLLNLASGGQGGGINMSNVDMEITNCVLSLNFAEAPGFGGAISFNDTDTSTVVMTNNTLVENSGDLAAGISAWTDDTGALEITMQNNALINTGINYAIEDGTPILISNGGNFVSDDSGNAAFTDPTDLVEASEDPLFMDTGDFDYRLTEGSPLIDAGVSAGAPAEDLAGNLRDETPDVGAYEFVILDNTTYVIDSASDLSVAPNPVSTTATISLTNNWQGQYTILIYNTEGRVLYQQEIEKFSPESDHLLDLSQLPTGNYVLLAHQNGRAVITKLVKF